VKKLICHTLLFSDPHFSVNSEEREEKWFPPLCSLMPNWMTKGFLHFWDNLTQNAFKKMLAKSIEYYGVFDLVVGCGDYTPGSNESGMITQPSLSQYNQFDEVLYKAVGYAPKVLVWGDHDTGYRFNVSSNMGIKIGTELGGVNSLSIHRAENYIGSAFGMLDLGVKKIVHISTNLIRNVDNSSDTYLYDLQEQQEVFIANVLENAQEDEIVFLLHDPTAIDTNDGIGLLLATHVSKIHVLLHGHMHARWFARVMRVVYNPYRHLCKLFPTHVIPASWGMMGVGKGFGIMDIFDDGTVNLHWH